MSYCALKFVNPNNIVETEQEFGNAWGFQPAVWSHIGEKYCGDANIAFTMAMKSPEEQQKLFWGLVKDPRLENHERMVLGFTYDNAILEREHFERMAGYLEKFQDERKEKNPECWGHFYAIAKALREAPAEVKGACLHGTSVTEDPWAPFDEEKEEHVPYDLSQGDKHWFVFGAYQQYLKRDAETGHIL